MKRGTLIIMETLSGGGAEKVLDDLLRNWDFDRFPLTLLLLHAYGPYIDAIPPQVEIIALNREPATLVERALEHVLPLRKVGLRRQLKRALGDRCFDTIISWMEGPAMRAHSMLFDRAARHISWVHINLNVNPWSTYFFGSTAAEVDAYRHMDRIVFVSNGAREAFRQRYGLDDGLEVIYNIIDRDTILRRAEEESVKHDRFTIVCVGRMENQKRHDRLITMVDELRRRGHDPEVWLLGVGKLESQIRRQIADLGLEDNVRLLGFKSNPYPYIKAADLMVMSSDTEGFSLVVAEALCVGTPVVSTDITGPDELLADGGGVLTPLDAVAMADAVERLITDSSELKRLADEAYERGKRFEPKKVVEKIERLLDELQ